MSSANRHGTDTPSLEIPAAWQAFLSSGEYARAQASLRAGSSELSVGMLARLEFVDERNLAIHLALTEDDPPPADTPGQAPVQLLTPRERSVIALIATGHETGEIAETLHVSPSTVRSHVRNSMSKLGAHTRAQLVAVAMEGQGALDFTQTDDRARDKSSS
jgi:DNA-binding NarL/FixJ family response regulator